jgi:hypothetical protein
VTRQEAIAEAVRFLEQDAPGMVHPQLGPIVIRDELIIEHELGWAIPFDSRAFLDTGDIGKAAVPSVVVVAKEGPPPFLPPSYLPVRDYLDEVRENGGWAAAFDE